MAFKQNTIVQEEKDFSKYGKDFQAKVLALLMKDRPFAMSILPIIKENYFSDVYFLKIFSAVKTYLEKYPNSTPTTDNIKIVLQDAGEKIISYGKILTSIEEISLEDRDFVIGNAHNFCFTKHALLENEKIVEELKKGNFDKAKNLSVEAFKYTGNTSAKQYDLEKDYEIIFEDEKLRAPVPMPFNIFNQHTKGGIGIGDLGLIVAPSNFGKSAAMQAIARHANFMKKNVLYFSYELSGAPILSRYIAGLVDIPQEQLKNNRDVVDAKLQEKDMGKFRIIYDKAINATVPNIRNHIEHLKSTNFFPDLIIVDGLNQLRLITHGENRQWAKDDNAKYELLADDLRDMLIELNLSGWASWQTNKLGFGAALNDIKAVGKAIEVFQKADLVITFSQTQEQKAAGECIGYLLKNRHGPNELALLCDYDPNKGMFYEKNLVNPLVLADDATKQRVGATISTFKEKLHTGVFDKKKK